MSVSLIVAIVLLVIALVISIRRMRRDDSRPMPVNNLKAEIRE